MIKFANKTLFVENGTDENDAISEQITTFLFKGLPTEALLAIS